MRWRPIVGWWLAHGVLVAAAALVAFPTAHGSGAHLGAALDRWGVWQDDAVNYAHVAFQGYTASPAWPAYWPGVPLLIVLTRSPWITLAVVQVALLAVMRLMATVAMDLGLSASAALTAVALFALNPAAVYYSSAYPELWVVGGFLLAIWATLHRRPWPMAVGIGVATIMDPLGAVVGLLPLLLAIQSWRRRDKPGLAAGLAGVAAGGLVVLGFCGYLAATVGNPLAMVAAQRSWVGTWTLPWAQVLQVVRGTAPARAATNEWGAIFFVAFAVSGIASLAARARRRPSGAMGMVVIVAAVVALVGLSFSADRVPMLSTGRFMSLDAPIYLGVATMNRLRIAALVGGGLIGFVGAIAFTHGYFWW